MGNPRTGTGYGYATYGMSPELIKKYIVQESNPAALEAVGLENAYQNFLNAEPPELRRRRELLQIADDKAQASKERADFDAANLVRQGVKDYGSKLILTPGFSISPTPTPNIKDFETLLANQGPSTPIKYYPDLNKGKGGYAPVIPKNPSLASDTQEVNIAASAKDPFLNKADQLLDDLKASKDAQTAERKRTKRDNTGDLAETTDLLKNLNFFGGDESFDDPSLIAAEYKPTPVPGPPDCLSPNMRGARNYARENPGKYNPFLPDNINRHFMGLPPV